MLFLSYVQRKPSDESNQLHRKLSQLHITECLCSRRCAFTARVPFKKVYKWISRIFAIWRFCQNKATQSFCWQWIKTWKRKNNEEKKNSQKMCAFVNLKSVEGQEKKMASCIKVGIESHTWAVWLTSTVQRNRFCIKCLWSWYATLRQLCCVVYTLTKPLQLLVSFPLSGYMGTASLMIFFFPSSLLIL